MATFAEDPLERGQSRPSRQLVDVARKYTHDPGGRVVVVDSRGTSILDTASTAGRSFASRPEFRSTLGRHPTIATGTRHSATLGTDLIYVAVPITAPSGKTLGALRITYPTSALDSRVTHYWLLLAAIGGVVLAAATLVGLRFARTLTRPLSALEHAAAAVGGAISRRARRNRGRPRSARSPRSSTRRWLGWTPCSNRSRSSSRTRRTSCGRRSPRSGCSLENLERDVDEGGRNGPRRRARRGRAARASRRRAPGTRACRRGEAGAGHGRPRAARRHAPRALAAGSRAARRGARGPHRAVPAGTRDSRRAGPGARQPALERSRSLPAGIDARHRGAGCSRRCRTARDR